jgi:hypothetical protein
MTTPLPLEITLVDLVSQFPTWEKLPTTSHPRVVELRRWIGDRMTKRHFPSHSLAYLSVRDSLLNLHIQPPPRPPPVDLVNDLETRLKPTIVGSANIASDAVRKETQSIKLHIDAKDVGMRILVTGETADVVNRIDQLETKMTEGLRILQTAIESLSTRKRKMGEIEALEAMMPIEKRTRRGNVY